MSDYTNNNFLFSKIKIKIKSELAFLPTNGCLEFKKNLLQPYYLFVCTDKQKNKFYSKKVYNNHFFY